tara:strand:+ start:61 stop:654 length:594 start_codon:yes stop_codon:yes gene_type:complete
MACEALTKGRGLDCNRSSGGVRYLYFSVYDDISTYAYSSATGTSEQMIDTINFNSHSIYRYTVPRGSTTIDEAITGDSIAGTIYYTPVVSMVLNKITKDMQEQMKLLGATQVRIFAQLNEQHTATGNDVIVCLGMVNGMSLNAGTIDSGAGFGDRNGYTLTWDGLESIPFPMLEDVGAGAAYFSNSGITGLTSIITE